MKPNKHRGHVASEEVRGILAGLADAICDTQDRVVLSFSGNTFEIHLDDATVNINITMNMEGGEA